MVAFSQLTALTGLAATLGASLVSALPAPAYFESREVNGVTRMLPRAGSRTESALRRRASVQPILTFDGVLQFKPDGDDTSYYLQDNLFVDAGYGLRALGVADFSPISVSLTSTGQYVDGKQLYYMTPAAGDDNLGPYFCMSGDNDGADGGDYLVYLDGCLVLDVSRDGPVGDGDAGDSANHPYSEFLFTLDAATGEIQPVWFWKDGNGVSHDTGSFRTTLGLLAYASPATENPAGTAGILTLVAQATV